MSKLDKMTPRQLALYLFKQGKKREVIIKVLEKQFPNKKLSNLNAAMTRAAMDCEGKNAYTWLKDKKK